MPSLLSPLRTAREWAMPTLKSSAFLKRGVLTPDEFVAAGDELVFKCPTWTWEAGDPARRKKHLPADKQFLATRNVPCPARAGALDNVVSDDAAGAGGGDGDDDDGDWLVSRILTTEELRTREERALEEGFDILDGDGEVVATPPDADAAEQMGRVSLAGDARGKQPPVAEEAESADEYADMAEIDADVAEFEDEGVTEDEAAVAAPGGNGHVMCRRYDVSITYDKYYQTPRVWLLGFSDDGSGRPLTGEEMMEDVIPDYAHRTVTVENHPHVSGPHASIHPCQHGAVMKTIVRNLTKDSGREGEGKEGSEGDGSGGPSVEMYIFIFLKFVSSMIPTINYDFTMDVSASTNK